MIPPRHLVLSGGGIKVISIVGALRSLEEKGYMKQVKVVSGVSAGAWLAFMISCGLGMKMIEKLVVDLEFGVVRNISPDAFIGFPETFGLDNGDNLKKFLESIMRIVIKMDPAITFEGHSKNKIQFKCWATDLNTRKIREFSVENTPSVKIIDALHASMAIPLYFTPVPDPETGHLLSDGGIQGSLPIHHLTDEECAECLAIGFSRDKSFPEDGEVPEDLVGFMGSILDCLIHSRNENVIRKWSHKIMRIPVDTIQSWNFEISREGRLNLVEQGKNSMVKWLNSPSHRSRQINRRLSL
jgi:predicted acylesterase/phospholipase RssA